MGKTFENRRRSRVRIKINIFRHACNNYEAKKKKRKFTIHINDTITRVRRRRIPHATYHASGEKPFVKNLAFLF